MSAQTSITMKPSDTKHTTVYNDNSVPLAHEIQLLTKPMPRIQRRLSLSSLSIRRTLKRSKSSNLYKHHRQKLLAPKSMDPDDHKQHEDDHKSSGTIKTHTKLQSNIIDPFVAKMDAKMQSMTDFVPRRYSIGSITELPHKFDVNTDPKLMLKHLKANAVKFRQNEAVDATDINVNNNSNSFQIRVTPPKTVKNDDKSMRKATISAKKSSSKLTRKSVKSELKKKKTKTKLKESKISKKKQIQNAKRRKIQENIRKYEAEKNRQQSQRFKSKKKLSVKNQKRVRRKSKSAQDVLRDAKKVKIKTNKSKKGSAKLRKGASIIAAQKKQRLLKAKRQVKRSETNLKNGRKYKTRKSDALSSAELKKIELSSAVWSALKQLRPIQRRKIEQEIKKQLQDEKNLMLQMKKDINAQKKKTEREHKIIQEKLRREQNKNKKDIEKISAERKALELRTQEIEALRKEYEQKNKFMDAELKKNELKRTQDKKKWSKTQQLAQQQRVQMFETEQWLKSEQKKQNVTQYILKRQQEANEKMLDKMDIMRLKKEKQQIMNRKHELQLKECEMEHKQEAITKKIHTMKSEVRRLSHDLSSEAAKIMMEINGGIAVEQDEQMKYGDAILQMLNKSMDSDHGIQLHYKQQLEHIQREKEELERKFNALKAKHAELEQRLSKPKSKTTCIAPKPGNNIVNIAPAPAPIAPIAGNIAPVPAAAPPAMHNKAPVPHMHNIAAAPPPMAPLPFNGTMPVLPPPLFCVPPLMKKEEEEESILVRAPPKNVKMRGLPWTKLKHDALNESMFAELKMDEDEIRLDFEMLDELWSKQKRVKKKKKAKKSSTRRRSKIEFLDQMDDDGKKGRMVNITIKAIKKSAEEIRDIIINMELEEKDEHKAEELVTAIYKMVPNEQQMKRLNAYVKSERYSSTDVACFDVGEKLWYYCRKIPFVSLRCKWWIFKLQFNERLHDQYAHINKLAAAYEAIYGNKNMHKVFQLILVIGNYLNYGHKKNGKAKGIRLDIFDKLRDLKANKMSTINKDNYTLLMYLVQMVNKHYAELANWTQIFTNCSECIKINIAELRKDVTTLCQKVGNLKTDLNQMMLKQNDSNDVYLDTMTQFAQNAECESAQLREMFMDTTAKCDKLVVSMGERLTSKYNLSHFWRDLNAIDQFWNEAKTALRVIEKKSIKKQKIADSLKRRKSKDIISKVHKYRDIAVKHAIEKQKETEIKLNECFGGLTRHQSLPLAQTRYKCAHCDVIEQNVANLNDNVYIHKCYASLSDKSAHKMSLQQLALDTKSDKCGFDHFGPCLFVYTESDETDEKTLKQQRKRESLTKWGKYGTSDGAKGSSMALNDLRMMKYGDMNSKQVLNNLNKKDEQYAVEKMQKNLKVWSQTRDEDDDILGLGSNCIIYHDKMERNEKKKKKKRSRKYNTSLKHKYKRLSKIKRNNAGNGMKANVSNKTREEHPYNNV